MRNILHGGYLVSIVEAVLTAIVICPYMTFFVQLIIAQPYRWAAARSINTVRMHARAVYRSRSLQQPVLGNIHTPSPGQARGSNAFPPMQEVVDLQGPVKILPLAGNINLHLACESHPTYPRHIPEGLSENLSGRFCLQRHNLPLQEPL